MTRSAPAQRWCSVASDLCSFWLFLHDLQSLLRLLDTDTGSFRPEKTVLSRLVTDAPWLSFQGGCWWVMGWCVSLSHVSSPEAASQCHPAGLRAPLTLTWSDLDGVRPQTDWAPAWRHVSGQSGAELQEASRPEPPSWCGSAHCG